MGCMKKKFEKNKVVGILVKNICDYKWAVQKKKYGCSGC